MVTEKKKQSPLLQLVAGGFAGLVESSICHPLVSSVSSVMALLEKEDTYL
jgi:hypothetical protein